MRKRRYGLDRGRSRVVDPASGGGISEEHETVVAANLVEDGGVDDAGGVLQTGSILNEGSVSFAGVRDANVRIVYSSH